DLPLLTSGTNSNGGKTDTAFLYRSLLTSYSAEMPVLAPRLYGENNPAVANGRLEVSGVPLEYLYNLAFFGAGNWSYAYSLAEFKNRSLHPVLELSDTSDFAHDRQKRSLKGLYAYSLILPKEKSNEETLMRAIQLDLAKFFGYEVTIESRPSKVYFLRVNDHAKFAAIKTKGGEPKFFINENKYNSFKFNNQPFIEL